MRIASFERFAGVRSKVDFLMSGESDVGASISALAERGYEGVQVTFTRTAPGYR